MNRLIAEIEKAAKSKEKSTSNQFKKGAEFRDDNNYSDYWDSNYWDDEYADGDGSYPDNDKY